MIVATAVATDARVLKEATTLVAAGHTVHIIGKNVPGDFVPPPGVTISSVGASSVLRKQGAQSLSGRKLSPPMAFARWVMLPTHRNSTFARFGEAAEHIAHELVINGDGFDVVHAHDFTSLEVGVRIAAHAAVPLIYDTHEFWSGRSREYRPTPLQDAHERRLEGELAAMAAAVITVGDGVAEALRQQYKENNWPHITTVRNSFPALPEDITASLPDLPEKPHGIIYAGRIGAHRELETAAAAATTLTNEGIDVRLMGPVDNTWLNSHDTGAATIVAPTRPDEVDAHLRTCGLVLVALAPGWKNHELALPNKLFHAVRAGVPMVASDIGELAAVVRKYNLGTLYTPGNSDSLVQATREAIAKYSDLCQSVQAAQHELSWESDGAALLSVYDSLSGATPPHLPPTTKTQHTTARVVREPMARAVRTLRAHTRASTRKGE
ncbi:glycosyltransferase [Dermatophilus congolensis]|uniref:PEP-CTERM/exosortase A-associated glycosyltransferase, Daro_2409 family n=1 Tax=Dermatophilus congolensis TaxID=1863 RepID=A0AA46H0V1_9MICO|nr:glycosyltransferase [Dermatophilus congolensis]MBO3143369.1 glycosyltransferase family 4 protein [Dermatophilus congolensis]MBO3152358.1 glycosyltransferase family 4 protein [Dermatophilus congolensis]MBO3160631.1 glycosyltransferase family 4 protein [Dermatophilus congolensis]MBO3163646.1 glycosyltransferase family 4 protein [Dermatophilus congolensis]MBO3177192.1 glycosyltransferase family 4 protein [Dermatophilus congolensis]